MHSEWFKPRLTDLFIPKLSAGYHALALPAFVLFTNFLFFGLPYFQQIWLFLSCSLLALLFYSNMLIVLNFICICTAKKFPAHQQSGLRVLWSVASSSLFVVVHTGILLLIFSLLPLQQAASLSIGQLVALFHPALFISFAFCLIAELQYVQQLYYKQSKEKAADTKEILALKNQLQYKQADSHFIFSNLTTLETLIAQDPAQAERFVQQLSKMFRHFLQAKKPVLHTLREEIKILNKYYQLLQLKHGESLKLLISIDPAYMSMQLPPLCLQLLLNNTIRHNHLTEEAPLTVEISTAGSAHLLLRNNLQPRKVKAASFGMGLSGISAQYGLYHKEGLLIEESSSHFTILIPLIQKNKEKTQPLPAGFVW